MAIARWVVASLLIGTAVVGGLVIASGETNYATVALFCGNLVLVALVLFRIYGRG